MPLFKFCSPDHDIHKGAQLRVGTLFSYRKIENPELKDEGEGKYKFQIYFPEPITLDPRWANLLLQGAIAFGNTDGIPRFPGRYITKVDSLHVIEQTKAGVTVKDTCISIERDVLNCLIFCMSLLEHAGQKPFANYGDYWSFAENRADEFGRRLGSLIFQQTKLSAFDGSVMERHSPASVSGLSLNVRHRRVAYRERQLVITPNNKPSFEELVNILSDIAFLKPEKFSPEQEYRFVFELGDGQVFYPPLVDHLLINPNILTSL